MIIQTKHPAFALKTLCLFGMLAFIFFSFSCKPRNPEQNKLDSLESNLKYKSYKTLSENTIPPVLLLYNSTNRVEDLKVSEGVLRLLLGYSWLVSEQPDFAIAESKIIEDISTDDKDLKTLAYSLTAIAAYDKGWKLLAAEEAENGSGLLMKIPKDSQQLKEMTLHLILGTLSIYQENYHRARFHFMAFGSVTGSKWPYQVADAMADMKDHKTQQGLVKIKNVSVDKKLPDTLRKSLKESLAVANNTTSPVDPKIFWPRLASYTLYHEMKNTDIIGVGKVTELLGNLNQKLKNE